MNVTEEWLLRPGGLATRLRNLRRDAGKTGYDLAAELGWIQPKVSKIENGKQLPTPQDVEAWAQACGADEQATRELHELVAASRALHREWREQVRRGQASIQHDYDELAQQATLIRNAELTVIPGLLQTRSYARGQAMQGVILHGANPDEIDASVEARMRRQEVLYNESKRFEFVITEAALRLGWCPAPAMLTQLERLVTVTLGPPHIWFGIIPFGADLPVVAQARFVMFDDMAIVEDYVDEVTYRDDKAETFAKAMDLLKAEAVTDDPARRLIARAMEELRRKV